MKKILFTLIGVMALTLNSCLKESGYTSEFWQYVTIEKAPNKVTFKGYYTDEVFTNIANIKNPEQLGAYQLEDAQIALVKMRLEVDASYQQTLTVMEGHPISVQSITTAMPSDSLKPFWVEFTPIFNEYNSPYVWVKNGYLNVLSTIPAKKAGNYFLMPEKATNDTLYFRFAASYEEDRSNKVDQSSFYDLRTLRNTEQADEELGNKMAEMLKALESNNSESVRIFLISEFTQYNYNYLGRDTTWTDTIPSNDFKYNF